MAAQDIQRKLMIFLSHASEDKAKVRMLCQQLQGDGFDPWLDEERLLPGQDWHLEIEKALQASDVILLCFSSLSIAKEGYVQREYKRAMQRMEEKPEGTIFVIPVKMDNCESPHFIHNIQSIDYPDGYKRLVLSLQIRAGNLQQVRHLAGKTQASPNVSSSIRLYNPELAATPVIETNERIVTLGRAPKNTVIVADLEVSWEHGCILLRQDGYIYHHLSKSNPTIIRRRHEEFLLRPDRNEEVVLRNQDRLIIGKSTFIVEFDLIAEDTGYTTTHKKSEDADDH